MRLHFRRLLMGLSTVLGIAPRGFFVPYRYADSLADSENGCFVGALRVFQTAEPAFESVLSWMDEYRDELSSIGSGVPPEPRWEQDWFPGLDGAAAYCMMRHHRPARVIEVGSGHSTRFFVRAARDADLDMSIIAIDPAPRADLKGLDIRFLQTTIQNVAVDEFEILKSGDVLSIDSSHILMPGTDVDILLNRVLPLLPVGVMVHIHDVFLPDGYPGTWEWRGYNEQLGVAPLLESGVFKVLWSSHYVRRYMARALSASYGGHLPLPTGAHESSLWLRRANSAAR